MWKNVRLIVELNQLIVESTPVVIFTNPNFAHESNRFDLDEMNDDECKAIRVKHPLFVTEIKFNLRFEGFRPNGFRCTCVCMVQWSFQPDQSKQLSFSYSKK